MFIIECTKNDLIISCHNSLLGAIPNSLRGLTVKLESRTLFWKGYFEGEPTEEEKEILSIACTEVVADFSFINNVKEEYIFHPKPLKMEMLQFWAFLKWEQDRF